MASIPTTLPKQTAPAPAPKPAPGTPGGFNPYPQFPAAIQGQQQSDLVNAMLQGSLGTDVLQNQNSQQQQALSNSASQFGLGQQGQLLGIQQGTLNRQGPLEALLNSLQNQGLDLTQQQVGNQYQNALAGMYANEATSGAVGQMANAPVVGEAPATPGTPGTPGTPAHHVGGLNGTWQGGSPGTPGTPGTPAHAIHALSPYQQIGFNQNIANQRLGLQRQQLGATYGEQKAQLADQQARLNLASQKLGFDVSQLPKEQQLQAIASLMLSKCRNSHKSRTPLTKSKLTSACLVTSSTPS